MPFALIFLALVLITAGFRGTQACLFTLLKQDFSGQFVVWAVAILIVGALGYAKPLAPVSNALLVLLIVVLFLGHGGFFTQASNTFRNISSSTNSGVSNTGSLTNFGALPLATFSLTATNPLLLPSPATAPAGS